MFDGDVLGELYYGVQCAIDRRPRRGLVLYGVCLMCGYNVCGGHHTTTRHRHGRALFTHRRRRDERGRGGRFLFGAVASAKPKTISAKTAAFSSTRCRSDVVAAAAVAAFAASPRMSHTFRIYVYRSIKRCRHIIQQISAYVPAPQTFRVIWLYTRSTYLRRTSRGESGEHIAAMAYCLY